MTPNLYLVLAYLGLAGALALAYAIGRHVQVRRRAANAEPMRLSCLVTGCEEQLEEVPGGGAHYCHYGHCYVERRCRLGAEIYRYSPGDCLFPHRHTRACWDRDELPAARRLVAVEGRRRG